MSLLLTSMTQQQSTCLLVYPWMMSSGSRYTIREGSPAPKQQRLLAKCLLAPI